MSTQAQLKEILTENEKEQADKFINLSKDDTFVDCLDDLDDYKHLNQAAFEFLTCLEIETDNKSSDLENAFIIKRMADSLCNSIIFAARSEKAKLAEEIGKLDELTRDFCGDEISSLNLEKQINKVKGYENRVKKYRDIYATLAYKVYPDVIDHILPVIPEYYAQNISRKFEPFVDKQKYLKQKQRENLTASKLEAAEILKKYGK